MSVAIKMSNEETQFLRSATCSLDLYVKSAKHKRLEILDSFNCTYTLYESMNLLNVSPEGVYMRADPLRHPLIFYLGHTAVFFVNKLVLAKLLSPNNRVNPTIESLLSVGVDEMSWDTLLPEKFDWPTLDSVIEYRNKVRSMVSDLIMSESTTPMIDNSVIDWDHPMWPIIMGIEHERVHLETSSVLIRQLPLSVLNPKVPYWSPPTPLGIFGENNIFRRCCASWSSSVAVENELIPVGEGEVHLGRLHKKYAGPKSDATQFQTSNVYGWDNEFGAHKAKVDEFKASSKLISNAEFLQFVRANGYETKQFWSDEGWRWVNYTGAKFPHFWVQKSPGCFVVRNMLEETASMPLNWPVEVNCLEANAYCRWLSITKGVQIRLPTEDEYARIYQTAYHHGHSDFSIPQKANLALNHYSSSCPTNEFAQGQFYDVLGNVWQWTKTPIYPFDYGLIDPLYDDFTIPTYDDKHNLIKGQSWISTGNEVTRHSRYAFRRHFMQHAGFRIVQQLISPDSYQTIYDPTDFEAKNYSAAITGNMSADGGGSIYDTDSLLSQYCEFHFGPQSPIADVENFPTVVARVCQLLIKSSCFWPSTSPLRALDIGCATGRTTIELTGVFDQVVGVDFSARLIQVPIELLERGRIRYRIPIEGEIYQHREIGFEQLNDSNSWATVKQIFGEESVAKHQHPNQLQLENVKEKVKFYQGDACNLSQTNVDLIQPFHLVVAANLIDRLYDPNRFLLEINNRLLPGGYLVLLSPYTWMSEFTPKENWLGGKKVNGENVATKEGLEEILSGTFRLISVAEIREKLGGKRGSDQSCPFGANPETVGSAGLFDSDTSFHVPFVIRETKRKYQFSFSECTIWQKI